MAQESKNRPSWPVFFLVVIVVSGLTWLVGTLMGMALAGSSSDSSSGLQEVLVDGEAEAEKRIAAIPIQGVIMETMGTGKGSVTRVKRILKAIKKDESVVGVLLLIDTPGGGVTASDRIYHDLSEFKKETELPIHAMFLDVAASGGYYVAMASDHITAHPTTVTGSIGVISKFFNFSDAMGKVGISVNVVKSLNSKGEVSFKDMGSPYRPMRPEERELLQNLITEMWDRFTEVVAAGREGKISPEDVKKLADGRIFTGKQALELKLVDQIGYSEDAYKKIREAAGHEDAKIVAYKKEPGLAQLLGLSVKIEDDFSESMSLAKEVLGQQRGFLYLWTAGI